VTHTLTLEWRDGGNLPQYHRHNRHYVGFHIPPIWKRNYEFRHIFRLDNANEFDRNSTKLRHMTAFFEYLAPKTAKRRTEKAQLSFVGEWRGDNQLGHKNSNKNMNKDFFLTIPTTFCIYCSKIIKTIREIAPPYSRTNTHHTYQTPSWQG